MSNKPVVAAIDFGTTYSGYAFSFGYEFQVDPLRISCTNHFHTRSGAGMSLKTPTCILFSPDQRFHSFGYEAEEKYSDLLMDEEHEAWYYFKRFKMILYNGQDLKRDTKWQASNGKPFPAIKIFSCAIEYLVNHMLSTMDGKLAGVKRDDVHWVLTVPAIWDDKAKHFMRTAAEMAGIKGENLSIALEPEAASFYCKYLPVEKLSDTGKSEISCFQTGKRYLVLDAGGGTVDITVHEVLHGGHLRELFKANGGPWGGTTVDKAFKDFLESLCGQQTLAKFERDFKDDYMDLLGEFEVKKRTVSPELDQKVTLKIPITLHEAFQDNHGRSFREAVAERYDLQGKLVFAGDKMRVEPSLMKSFFQKTCDTIVGHLKNLFSKSELSGLSIILMVGGFSESPMLRHAIQTNFPQTRVVVPNEAGLAVLKGAVIFGHQPKIVSSRVSKYTYGIGVIRHAQSDDPPEKLFQESNARLMCKDTFSKHAEIGQEIEVDSKLGGLTYCPASEDTKYLKIALYTSTKKTPKFVDEDGCTLLGTINVKLAKHGGHERKVFVRLMFGGTELGVEAIEVKTGKVTKAFFDYLE
ncbi:hypothetical protein CHS0354_028718 [Potamilus streckersoni]|uniref:Heat shock 70 kDa protein 12A n=1 Tax=Potamilus streckersoni TaxID=2493646 RepID=A0AAE0SZL9_9BIVA|nr:hypothetical protein CHS0354_028718 [Potamilus streckersoni]